MLRLDEQVEGLINQVLRERYLVLERPSFRRIVGEIRAECDAKGFQPPSGKTIDLSPKLPPLGGESLGLICWPYAASLCIFVFSANSIGVRFLNAKCGLWVL